MAPNKLIPKIFSLLVDKLRKRLHLLKQFGRKVAPSTRAQLDVHGILHEPRLLRVLIASMHHGITPADPSHWTATNPN